MTKEKFLSVFNHQAKFFVNLLCFLKFATSLLCYNAKKINPKQSEKRYPD